MRTVPLALLVGLVPSLLAAPPARAVEPAKAAPTYVLVLPANVAFVAFLPVDAAKGKDLFDLDLKVEVVEPRSCGDKVAGLLRAGGPRLVEGDGPDEYQVVVARNAAGDCKKEATRIRARWAIRTRVVDGKTRKLVIGDRELTVARKGNDLTLDGQAPAGDDPGAPPTADPATFVTGEVSSAKLGAVTRAPDGQAATIDLTVGARWPKCAAAPLGFLARGSAATKFLLTDLAPVAIAPLDGSCGKATVEKTTPLVTIAHVAANATDVELHVGSKAVAVKLPPRPTGSAVAR